MQRLIEILFNALPEAIGGLIAAGIITLLSYLFVKRLRKVTPQEKAPQELLPEPPLPEIYSNLPSRTEFIGRKKEMERVKAALNSRYFLICIDGIGGIGKTSLALEVIHECLRFSKGEIAFEEEKQADSAIPKFDGFIWTSAKDRELRLNDILDAIARTLDWPGIAQQPYQEKAESVRKLLQTKRYLLIVDNFETITDEAVRDFLLKIPEPSKVLITSREQKLSQAWAVSIKGLEQDEALALIRNEGQRLGLKSVEEADDPVLLRLYQATGGAPLAIKWSVGQIKQKGQSLDTVLAALHEAKGDIFEEVFARSWSLLSEDAQKVLMVMPIFASSASRDAIEAASDVHHFALDEALGQLVQMWLVEVTDTLEEKLRRYTLHALTESFANAKLKRSDGYQNIFRERLINYYLAFSKRYGERNWRGYNALEIERENIMLIIDWCHEMKRWKQIMEFRNLIIDFLWIRGHWNDRLRLAFQALKAAEELNDRRTLAFCLVYDLGWTFIRRGEFASAQELIDKGKMIFEELHDSYGISLSLRNLGNIAHRQNKTEEALVLYKKSLEIAKAAKLDYSAHARMSIGNILCSKIRDFDAARKEYEIARDIFEKLGDEMWLTQAIVGLATVESKSGSKKESKLLYYHCLDTIRKIGRRDSIAHILWRLALQEEDSGNINIALKLANEANEHYERLALKREFEKTRELTERLEKKIR